MIEVVHWNPTRPVLSGRLGRRVPWRRPVNNFGDLLGPMIVAELSTRQGASKNTRRLVTVGSILHLATDGDTIWGTGVNGKVSDSKYEWTNLDVRAVRGPLTRRFLLDRAVPCPEVFGDPGLLVPELFPSWAEEARSRPRVGLTIVPNLNDLSWVGRQFSHDVLDPTLSVRHCITTIARSDLVVASSLHAVVIAEAFGVPARLFASRAESELKYADYYLGTGRRDFSIAPTVTAAIERGGEQPLDWDSRPLLDAFPIDLWA